MTTLPNARLKSRTGLALWDDRCDQLRRSARIAGRPVDLTADQRRDVTIASDLDVDRLTSTDIWHRHYGLEVSA